MQAYRLETILQKDGTLTLRHLPFQAGEEVEIIVLPRVRQAESAQRSLHGTPVEYRQPTEPVASDDWGAAQ